MMLLLYWLVGLLEALSTTGYLYSRHTRSFVGREGDVLSTHAQPERFAIHASGGNVQLLAGRVGDDTNGSACNGYRIEMNKTGEIRIRQGRRCEAVASGYLEGRRCSGNRNQRFVWIPASLLEGSGWQGKMKHFPSGGHRPRRKHRSHPHGTAGQKHVHRQYHKHARHGYSDSSDHHYMPAGGIKKDRRPGYSDSCDDLFAPTDMPKKGRGRHGQWRHSSIRQCRRSKRHHRGNPSGDDQPALITRPEKYRYNKRANCPTLGQPRHKQKHEISSSSSDGEEAEAQPVLRQDTNQALDVYARIFCLQHPDIRECRSFNRIKAEENIRRRIKLSGTDSSEDMESTSDPNVAGAKIDAQPRIRGYFAGGVDYDDGCSCDGECIRNPKNGQCYYRMDDDGNLTPMVKPCRCGNGNDLCKLPNAVDKFFCELTFLNDYAYFSRMLDSGIKASQ